MAQQLITKDFLDDIGIELPAEEEALFLAHINETLVDRINREMSDELTDEQAGAMFELSAGSDEAAFQDWLKENVSELSRIVRDEIDILLGEIAENADAVMQVSAEEPVSDDKTNLETVETDLLDAATAENDSAE
jgi:hypothetical protein